MDHTGFTLIEEKNMPEVCGTARLWKHDVTDAQILSIVNDDENKCFGAAFRTPPKNSTGVTHIIEHSVLCGSRKYPVKEPFVNLLKGSLQTFLNAFTFPDKTCYPVASANLQDFYNLIDVYMDAVFHPLISENSFRQEGWHIEADSPDGPWQYKGVVFNEMKGVYSSPDACLAEETQHAVFPDTLYSLESGGRPSDIPSLTYQAYRDFYSTYYHPSNARFFFWGDDPEEKRLAIVREELKEYSRRNVDSAIPLQPPFTAPHQVEIPYAVPPEAKDPKCLFTLNWLLGERTDVEACITLEMLENILEGMPGSPLRPHFVRTRRRHHGRGPRDGTQADVLFNWPQGHSQKGYRQSRNPHFRYPRRSRRKGDPLLCRGSRGEHRGVQLPREQFRQLPPRARRHASGSFRMAL